MKRRNTPAKKAVLALLAETGEAMCGDAIAQRLTIKINRATVYRILNRCCEDGIIHRIVAEDGKQYFAIRPTYLDEAPADHHFHFRCLKCQTIECLPTAVDLSVPNGYQVKRVNCVLSGICSNCAI